MARRFNGVSKQLTAAAMVLVCATGAACGSSGGDDPVADTTTTVGGDAIVSEGDPVEGGSLTIAVESETAGWNPASTTWATEGNLIGSTFFEPLAVINSKGEVVPWLAESITPNENATEWTVVLRQGIPFQDGTEMDAQAAVDSLAFQNSDAALTSIVTKKLIGEPTVTGKYSLVIPVNMQWGAFAAQLTTSYGYVMAPSMLSSADAGANGPIGTGAYQFEKAEKDRFVRVKPFADYWGGPCVAEDPSQAVATLCEDMGVPIGQRNGPFLTSMEFRPIPDSVQRVQALEAGDVDLILNTRPGITADARTSFQVVTGYSTEQNFVQLSASKPPFDNIHARRALAYATDREALVQQLGAGEDIPMDTSPYEEDNPWGGFAPDETGYPLYDPVKAQEELELYKEQTGAEKLAFSLMGTATLDDLEVMQALASQWASHGIEANIESLKKEAVIGIQVGGEFQAIVSRLYSFPDPDQNYIFWSDDFIDPPFILNFSQFATPETQAALRLGRESQDPDFRKQAYDELFRIRNENAIDIWLFNTPWSIISEPNVRGLNAFRGLGIAGYNAKPWVMGLWVGE